ncbi:MAG: hypothetical protein WDO56_36545 [Gammaproteobacteria bacterium]
MSGDASIARYEEKRFDGKRVFELRGDHLAIVGSTALGPRFDLKVPLDALVPEPDKMWARPNGFWAGIGMLITFVMVIMGFESVLSSWWQGFFGVLAASGALLALATWRRVEWAVFKNVAGTPTVTIARSSARNEDFERFVDAVQAAIDTCKSASAGRSTSLRA